jgi:uncharacterized protein YgiM (DUF1202 family)
MPDSWRFSTLGLILAVAVFCSSCAALQPQQPQGFYYTIPSVTYFRDSPGYASRNVATVYRGEQVAIQSTIADNWCLVKAVQSGQTGWIQRPLLSPVPIPTETFTVKEQEVPLRDVPQKEATSRQVLHRGDQVRKLSENQQGWWWVLVEKDEGLGWLPGTAVTQGASVAAAPGAAAGPASQAAGEKTAGAGPPSPSYVYVATATLNLHLLPLVDSQVVKVLKFKDKAEKIAQSGSAWLKVKYPETGAQGWAQAPALTASPLTAPKVFPPKKKAVVKKSRRQKTAVPEVPQPEAPPDTPQPKDVEPEVM